MVWGFPGGSDGKQPACNAGDPGSIPGSGRSPGGGNSSILAGESHGQRSLAGYSPWSHKELDVTEQLTLSLFFSQARYSVVSQAFSGPETL